MHTKNKKKVIKKYSLRRTVKEVLFDINLTSGDDSQEDDIIYERALKKCLPPLNSNIKSRTMSCRHSEFHIKTSTDSLFCSLNCQLPQSKTSECLNLLPTCSAASASSHSLSFASSDQQSKKKSLGSTSLQPSFHCSSLDHSSYSSQQNFTPLLSSNLSSINSPSSLSAYSSSSPSFKSCKSLTPSSPLSSHETSNITITPQTKPRLSLKHLSPFSPLPTQSSLSQLSPSSSSSLCSFASYEGSDSEKFLPLSRKSLFQFCKSKLPGKFQTLLQTSKSLKAKKKDISLNSPTNKPTECKVLRRSSRKRVKPLEFWRGEIPIYKPQSDGTYVLDKILKGSSPSITNKRPKINASGIKKICTQRSKKSFLQSSLISTNNQIQQKTCKSNVLTTTQPKTILETFKRSQDVSSQTITLSESTEENIKSHHSENLIKTYVKVSAESEAPKVTLVDKSTGSEIIVKNNFERLETPKFKNKLDWKVSQTSKDVFLASADTNQDANRRRGYLKILGKGEKPLQITGSYEMDLMIIDGKVAVTIGGADAVIFSYPDTFSIPSHTCYSIKNLLETEAFFSFYVFTQS